LGATAGLSSSAELTTTLQHKPANTPKPWSETPEAKQKRGLRPFHVSGTLTCLSKLNGLVPSI
jgi:hypothetical protein